MEYVILALNLFNTLLLIGIAGTVVKLVKSIRGESDELVGITRDRQLVDLSGRQPTYVDVALMEPPPNWDGVSSVQKNWDGVPRRPQ